MKTVLLITPLHDLVHSDLICMVEGGRIAEQGTHKVLIKEKRPLRPAIPGAAGPGTLATEARETLCEEAV